MLEGAFGKGQDKPNVNLCSLDVLPNLGFGLRLCSHDVAVYSDELRNEK